MDEKRIFQTHAKTFSFAAAMLPKATYEKACTLYAFCRHCDDLADTAITPAEQETAMKELEKVALELKQKHSDKPLIKAMHSLIQFDRVPLNAALELIQGIQSDLSLVRIETEQGLIDYAYHVAGTVGEMMCPLLGVANNQAIQFGIDLGIAMQLTNIVRDVLEDASLNRLYLPTQWLGFDNPDLLMQSNHRAQTQAAMKKVLQLSERYYQFASHGLSYIPFRSRIAIIIALRLYRHIGIKIAKNNYAYWHGRVASSRFEKITIAGKSGLDCLLGNHQHAHQQL